MGWLIAIPMLIFGCVQGNDTLVITSAIFAVAGSIGSVATQLVNKSNNNKTTNDNQNT